MVSIAKFVGILTFRADAPVCIGAQEERNVVYALHLPEGRGFLIPATSWKGAFRAIAERLAQKLKMSNLEKLAIDNPRDENFSERSLNLIKKFEVALKGGEPYPVSRAEILKLLGELGYTDDEIKEEQASSLLKTFLDYYDPIGKLFGNSVWASSIRFMDTVLPFNSQRRPGIGINRRTGTVNEGSLYYTETTPTGISIKLNITGELDISDSTPLRLLASTIETVKLIGLTLGRRKSSGLGILTLSDAKFHVVKLGEDVDGSFLANPFKAPVKTVDEFIAWLKHTK
jgi:CRISPR/Cas system CSM-associated protein Csm3 (group 7 of RAMP superfamily)